MPKASSGWDDDDDVPLASMGNSKGAAQATSAPARALAPKAKEEKKDREVRQRKPQPSKSDFDDFKPSSNRRSSSGKQTLPEYVQANMGNIIVGTVVLVLIYGSIVSDGTNFNTDESASRIDPYKALGLSTAASDKEIKAAYRKLSLELHPDKNADQSEEDKAKFDEVTQGYKILSDPEKKKKWLNHENVDDKGIPSDTLTLTDETAHELNKGAWLLLAYADWSSECWDLAETWEKVGKDLGRYVHVARFNYEKSPKLAKKFQTFSVPMIYCYVDGVRTPFLGEPNHVNVTLFITKCLTESAEVIRDSSAGMFLENQDQRVKAMLFAQQGMVKLRLAFRSMAVQHKHVMDFAEVTYIGSEAMRALFGVNEEPAIVFIKEKGSQPLKYTGKMTQVKLAALFQQHQHHWTPRLNEHNFKSLCGAGLLGTQPCVVYLTQGGPPSVGVMETLRNASSLDLDAMAASTVDRAPTTYGWVDLAEQTEVSKAFGGNKAQVVALDALTKTFAPYDGPVTAEDLKDWAETFRGRLESDMDPLAGPLTFVREARASGSWRQWLRQLTPHLMTTIAVVAAWLLWYALHSLWSDLKMTGKKDKLKKVIEKGRAKIVEGETRKLSKWEVLEKQNSEARDKKRMVEEERDAKRLAIEAEAAAAAARDAEAQKVRAAEAAKQAALAAREQPHAKLPVQTPKSQNKKIVEVTDVELKRAIRDIVAAANLATTTKSSIRLALQAKYPDLDLLPRKDLVQSEIAAAVSARMQ
mmetsp:Transcript_47478/g.69593  ORF Transcript_47478/g.69593 Transcript_47478/m.69593 type:complete len:754 (+) Transcript_47478:88-2349(+)